MTTNMPNTTQGSFYTGYENAYTSLPGSAIKATWAGQDIGTLQGITVSISAEKAPIYVMGRQTPRGFTTNKIGIAGSAVFINMDRDVLWNQLVDPKNAIVNIENTGFEAQDGKVTTNDAIAVGGHPDGLIGDESPRALETSANNAIQSLGAKASLEKAELLRRQPLYAAQLGGFDVVLTGITPDGRGAFKAIRGVELINEGFATTIDDGTLESQYTFVAREVTRWTPISGKSGAEARGADTAAGNGGAGIV